LTISLSASEIVKTAIEIEKRGIAYYDVMATSTWHEVARDLFKHLANMEKNHRDAFENMLSQIEKKDAEQQPDKDEAAYIQSLADSAVFTNELAASELATHLDSVVEAMDIAITAEKESILFYYELLDVTSQATAQAVRSILNEEKLHLTQLSEIKKRIENL
jgi:rubrerythrin